ncbi:MAG: hypothetical protein HZA50_11885 [Planctomycetes bacterium]|nr:hypothetical protein [Planctomycetota bacterium]
MTTPQELLKSNNPFYSNRVGNPWDDPYPDVESINHNAFDGILRLLGYKTKNPKDACAGLVLGETGTGKTHLLKRILHASRRTETPAVFTYVRPILDTTAPMRYLLREIVINLGKENDEAQKRTQLDLFAARILIDFLRNDQDPNRNAKLLKKLDEDPFYIYQAKIDPKIMEEAEKRAIRYLRRISPDISSDLLRVIVKYRKKEMRDLVVCWMRGDVIDGEEEANHLGTTTRVDKDIGTLEQEAKGLILSLGQLMARYGRPMLVCFDQLDNLYEPSAVRALEAMINILVREAQAMLPLAFVRADSWNERFKKTMDIAVVECLEANRFLLESCSMEQAEELVRRRVQAFLGSQTEMVFPWLWGQLKDQIKNGYFPGQVIVLAKRTIESEGEEGILRKLEETYHNECEAVLADLASWSPDGDRLALALETYLQASPDIKGLRKGKEKHVSFVFEAPGEKGKDIPHIAIVNVGGGYHRIGNCLKTGIEFLQKYPEGQGRCFYISDARNSIPIPPRWKATNELRQTFETMGGIMLILDKDAVARWYAITSLVFKVNEGDIQVEEGSGKLRAATREELNQMLREGISKGSFPSLLTAVKGPETAKPQPETPKRQDETRMMASVKSCLKDSPMRMLTISVLLGKLIQNKVKLDHAGLLAFLGQHKNIFRLFENKQGMTVMLDQT